MAMHDDETRGQVPAGDALDRLIDGGLDRMRRESVPDVRAAVMARVRDESPLTSSVVIGERFWRRVPPFRLVPALAVTGAIVLAVIAFIPNLSSVPPQIREPNASPVPTEGSAVTVQLPGLHGISAQPERRASTVAGPPPTAISAAVRAGSHTKRLVPVYVDSSPLDPADRLPDAAPIVVSPITVEPIETVLIQESSITVKPIVLPPFDLPSKGNDERVAEGVRK